MEPDRLSMLAHIDRETGREQTLREHSRRVAEYCGKYCGAVGLADLGRITGLLHDSGKGTLAFQRYLRDGDDSQRGKIPHSFCGARYCYENWGMDGTIKGLTAQLIAAAVCGHHGGLPDMTDVSGEDSLYRRAFPKQADYEQAVRNYLPECSSREELERLFEKAQEEVGALGFSIRKICGDLPEKARNKSFCFFLGLAQRYLESCLIDADRFDTYLFEANQEPAAPPDLPALWESLSSRLEKHLKAFPCKTPIDRKRREISEQCLEFRKNGRGIFRLSVPTGSGKTMSSLRYALGCAAENGKGRIFYIAPYRSILEQNAEDIKDALRSDKSDHPLDDVILEHHSDVVIDDDESGEKLKRYSLLTQRWDVPVILTTTVQLLNTLFDGRTGCARRMHSLADSVMILDEVQAIPVKCTYLLNAALDFLAYVLNCAVVLCTATQPDSEEMAVPVIPGKPEQMTGNLEETFAAFRRTRAVDKTAEGALSADGLADFILERLTGCDNLLAILNTKSAAAKLYRALQSRVETLPPEQKRPVYFLSTSLCPQHRMDIIKEIRGKLNDDPPGANRMICVSTQLIEAGVNLSFQCVVRSLAGLDSVAQAAGRCNRHGEDSCRDVFIVRCADENLSSLPDIERAQEAASDVLEAFEKNPAQFGGDLLSPEAVRSYYNHYFALQENRLAYPVNSKDDPKLFSPTDLFDLLSRNSLSKEACSDHRQPLPAHPMHQAFETAGNIFEAIEKGGHDVVVPYRKGKELIEKLYSGPDIREIPTLLRQLQRYTVHLFSGEWKKFDDLRAIHLPVDTGVAVLDGEYYHPQLGVQTGRGEMETMIF